MSTREQLNQYLRGLEKRLRLQVISKGAAIALSVALGATIALVFITNALAFSEASVMVARVVLFLSLAVALGVALVIPLLKLNQRGAAGKAETACPEFEERLLTYVERRDVKDPFLDLLRQSIGLARYGDQRRTIGGKVLVFREGRKDRIAAVLVRGERHSDGVSHRVMLDANFLKGLVNGVGCGPEIGKGLAKPRAGFPDLPEFALRC